MAYEINWVNGRTDTEDSLDDVHNTITRDYPDAVYCLNGGSFPLPMESELKDVGRILVWADEDSSINDSGAHAIADITQG